MQFLSDLVHIVEEFKAEGNGEKMSATDTELVGLREEKRRMDDRYSVLESQATELSKKNSGLISQVDTCYFRLFCSVVRISTRFAWL